MPARHLFRLALVHLAIGLVAVSGFVSAPVLAGAPEQAERLLQESGFTGGFIVPVSYTHLRAHET